METAVWVSSSLKEKIPIYTSQRERVGNAAYGYRRRGLNESREKVSLATVNGLLRGQLSRQISGQLLVLWLENYPCGSMSHKSSKSIKIWKGNGDTITLFYLKGIQISHQVRRRKVNIIVIEHFNNILFRSPDLQQVYLSINQSLVQSLV